MAVRVTHGFGCAVTTDTKGRELTPHGTHEFPCAAFDQCFRAAPGEDVPWHWHHEFEAIYVKSGVCRFRTIGHTEELRAGDVVFVNAHTYHTVSGSPVTNVLTLVFHPQLVGGQADSAISRRYVEPVVTAGETEYVVFRADDDLSAAQMHLRAFHAMEDEDDGFETVVRASLTELVLEVWKKIGRPSVGECSERPVEINRTHQMCTYIKEHLSEHLTVGDVARAAGVSERECLRCFRKAFELTPVRYILCMRLEKALNLLVGQRSMSISEIAKAVGFSSPGYFSQTFREEYGCTPREFRAEYERRFQLIGQQKNAS